LVTIYVVVRYVAIYVAVTDVVTHVVFVTVCCDTFVIVVTFTTLLFTLLRCVIAFTLLHLTILRCVTLLIYVAFVTPFVTLRCVYVCYVIAFVPLFTIYVTLRCYDFTRLRLLLLRYVVVVTLLFAFVVTFVVAHGYVTFAVCCSFSSLLRFTFTLRSRLYRVFVRYCSWLQCLCITVYGLYPRIVAHILPRLPVTTFGIWIGSPLLVHHTVVGFARLRCPVYGLLPTVDLPVAFCSLPFVGYVVPGLLLLRVGYVVVTLPAVVTVVTGYTLGYGYVLRVCRVTLFTFTTPPTRLFTRLIYIYCYVCVAAFTLFDSTLITFTVILRYGYVFTHTVTFCC